MPSNDAVKEVPARLAYCQLALLNGCVEPAAGCVDTHVNSIGVLLESKLSSLTLVAASREQEGLF